MPHQRCNEYAHDADNSPIQSNREPKYKCADYRALNANAMFSRAAQSRRARRRAEGAVLFGRASCATSDPALLGCIFRPPRLKMEHQSSGAPRARSAQYPAHGPRGDLVMKIAALVLFLGLVRLMNHIPTGNMRAIMLIRFLYPALSIPRLVHARVTPQPPSCEYLTPRDGRRRRDENR